MLPNIFNTEEIQKLRFDAENIFKPDCLYIGDVDGNESGFATRANIIERYPEFRWILKHSNFISTLKSLLGEDFVFLPEMSAQASAYGGWQKDTGSQEAAGHFFQWDKGYLMLEAAIYLQNNDTSGGGLDVVPRSHTKPLIFFPVLNRIIIKFIKPFIFFPVLNRIIIKFINILKKIFRITAYKNCLSLPSKNGDLVLFHFRIDHRASQPKHKSTPKVRKIALFFACSANTNHVNKYIDFLHSRKDYVYLNDANLYGKEVLELAKSNQINLAT